MKNNQRSSQKHPIFKKKEIRRSKLLFQKARLKQLNNKQTDPEAMEKRREIANILYNYDRLSLSKVKDKVNKVSKMQKELKEKG